MNERPRIPAMAAPSRPRGPIASAVTNEARSNLFRGQMMRRPAAGNHTSTASIADRVRLESEARSDVSEIVVRNQNGEIQLEDPSPLILEDLDDIVLDDGQEDEKERQRLSEAVNSHRISQSNAPEQPEEVLETLRASLRAKVSALADDNWMFEAEEQPRT